MLHCNWEGIGLFKMAYKRDSKKVVVCRVYIFLILLSYIVLVSNFSSRSAIASGHSLIIYEWYRWFRY